MSDGFYKRHKGDKIWWKSDRENGLWMFSFDKVKIYHIYRDYPQNLTVEERKLFDTENPQWAKRFG